MAKKPAPAAPEPQADKDRGPKLPQQIRDQISAADAIRADMGRDPQEDANEPSQPPAPPPANPPAPPPPPQPPAPAQPSLPPAAASAASPPQEGETLEQRYRSTAGRLEQALRLNEQMHERVQFLESQMASMRARGAEPPAPPQPAQPPARPKLVTDEEVQDFGEDLLNVVGKRAREEYAPEFEELAARLRRLEGRVEGASTVIERTQVQEVYHSLDQAVPNWRELNRSDDFKMWLQQPDFLSGRRRHDMLQEAFTGHEAGRVVAFFKGFLSEAASPPQNPQARTPSAPPLPGNGNGSGKPSLESFAAPGRARSAPQELPPDKPVYTHAWIAKFMADKRTGKYRGREADAEAIERDIYQAQHEGRIQ